MRLGKAPETLRMDLGTENIYCEDLQVFFTKSDDSFLYAASTHETNELKRFGLALKSLNCHGGSIFSQR